MSSSDREDVLEICLKFDKLKHIPIKCKRWYEEKKYQKVKTWSGIPAKTESYFKSSIPFLQRQKTMNVQD